MQDAQQMTTREEIEIVFRPTRNGLNTIALDAEPTDELPPRIPNRIIYGRCLCGQYLKRPGMPRHLKTLRHRNYTLANPDIRESRRMHLLLNKSDWIWIWI